MAELMTDFVQAFTAEFESCNRRRRSLASFTYICSPQVPLALHTELDGDARERNLGFAIFVELFGRASGRGHPSDALATMANDKLLVDLRLLRRSVG